MENIQKWEFVPEDTIDIDDRRLTRIRALVDYPNEHVKAGQLGGYIEKAENLGDWGWVGSNGRVYGNGQVFGNGRVCENGEVYGNG